MHLEQTQGGWRSVEKDAKGNPVFSFSSEDVKGYEFEDNIGSHVVPPYYIADEDGNPLWFLEQEKLVRGGDKVLQIGEQVPIKEQVDSEVKYQYGMGFRENGVTYPIPTLGDFRWAHRVKLQPEKYLDYLYVDRGRLAFKISEESQSFSEAMSTIPPFYVDEATKNKLQDLNDLQILKEYSTFVHQSEQPTTVENCGNFKPLVVDAVLKYGVEQRDEILGEDEDEPGLIVTDEWKADDSGQTYNNPRLIELSNLTNTTRLQLEFEDGEVDDYLKIYTNYVRKDDGHGDFHYDLYFNVQNLFNSPFEYISTVTNQPNVLVIPDSYLYLSGDKFKKVYEGDTWTHNEIDEKKIAEIKKGGELSIYGQVKVYSDDKLSDVRTIKLFSYQIYNVSDDKPKFLIEKTYDVTKATLQTKTTQMVKIDFSDLLLQLDESKFEFLDGEDDKFRILNQDVVFVQPIHVNYNWRADDDFRIRELSFDISNDIIDFGAVPVLCDYHAQERTPRKEFLDSNGKAWREPHYDHWSDNNMKLHFDDTTGVPRLTLTYPNGGYNFDTIYLKWKLPKGCRIMDTLDRLRGYVFSSTASNIVADCGNPMVLPEIETTIGHIVVRVKKIGTMYLGREHSTTKRMNGYVISNLASEIKNALLRGDFNPTLDTTITNLQKQKRNVTFDGNGGKFPDSGETIKTQTYNDFDTLGELPQVNFMFGV